LFWRCKRRSSSTWPVAASSHIRCTRHFSIPRSSAFDFNHILVVKHFSLHQHASYLTQQQEHSCGVYRKNAPVVRNTTKHSTTFSNNVAHPSDLKCIGLPCYLLLFHFLHNMSSGKFATVKVAAISDKRSSSTPHLNRCVFCFDTPSSPSPHEQTAASPLNRSLANGPSSQSLLFDRGLAYTHFYFDTNL
jgi:hypothetical protein